MLLCDPSSRMAALRLAYYRENYVLLVVIADVGCRGISYGCRAVDDAPWGDTRPVRVAAECRACSFLLAAPSPTHYGLTESMSVCACVCSMRVRNGSITGSDGGPITRETEDDPQPGRFAVGLKMAAARLGEPGASVPDDSTGGTIPAPFGAVALQAHSADPAIDSV